MDIALIPMQSDFVPSSNGSAMLTPMMNSHQGASMKAQMPAASQDKMMPNKERDKTMNVLVTANGNPSMKTKPSSLKQDA